MSTNYDILTLRETNVKQKKNIDIIYKLFDFKNDPLERSNIAKDNMDIVRKLSSEFFVWLVSTVNNQGKDYSSEERTDEETLKHLKSLGYVN